MQVKTGKGTISMMVVLAIWSLSLAVDLPGLAVTPIEGQLRSIFSDATDFKIQLLTVLPNLVIIPFVLLAGKLSETKHKIAVIVAGTVLYIAAGALSIFSSSLNMLILLSCLLGAGCGLILPFSTGLIADVFTGKYRMKQMGIISAIGNVALVVATFVVGFLAAKSWHLPFLVYLLPLVSLLLIPFLSKIPKSDYATAPASDEASSDKSDAAESTAKAASSSSSDASAAKPAAAASTYATPAFPTVDADGFSTVGQKVKGGFYIGRTIWLLLAYFFFVFATCIPSYYLPNFSWIDAESASTMTSVFYFAMFVIGLALTPCMKLFRKTTFIAATAMLVASFAIFIFTHNAVLYIIACALAGLGNGIAQPIFYTKATEVVTSESKSTLSLAYLQVANYVAISLVPVIISAARAIFHQPTSTLFPFVFVGIATAIVFIFVIIRSRHFVFGMSKKYYE